MLDNIKANSGDVALLTVFDIDDMFHTIWKYEQQGFKLVGNNLKKINDEYILCMIKEE